MTSLARSIFAMWRQTVRDVGKLPIWELLHRRGIRKIAARQEGAVGIAADRCMVCSSMAKCEQLLAAGRDAEIDAFCPNVMYLRHLDAMKRHATKEDLLGGPGA
jgi:hypothetical protein